MHLHIMELCQYPAKKIIDISLLFHCRLKNTVICIIVSKLPQSVCL